MVFHSSPHFFSVDTQTCYTHIGLAWMFFGRATKIFGIKARFKVYLRLLKCHDIWYHTSAHMPSSDQLWKIISIFMFKSGFTCHDISGALITPETCFSAAMKFPSSVPPRQLQRIMVTWEEILSQHFSFVRSVRN